MKFWLKLTIISSFVLFVFLKILLDIDYFQTVELTANEYCRLIETPYGVQDMNTWNGIVIGSMDDRVNSMFKHQSVQNASSGSLIAIDPLTEDWYQIPISGFSQDQVFHPHGIFIRGNKLFCINHAYGIQGDQIFIFQLSGQKNSIKANLKQILPFGPEYAGRLNDLVAINQNVLYTTVQKASADNPKGVEGGFVNSLKKLAYFEAIQGAQLLRCQYYENKTETSCRVEEKGFSFNGITIRESEIFVSDNAEKALYRYVLDEDGYIHYIDQVEFPYYADKLEYVLQEDRIFTAGIVRIIDFIDWESDVQSQIDPPMNIPGAVMVVDVDRDGMDIQTLGVLDILEFPSSATYIRGKLFLGSLVFPAVAVCEGLEKQDKHKIFF